IRYLISHYSLRKKIYVRLQGPVYGNDNQWLKEIRTYIRNYNLHDMVFVKDFTEDVATFYSEIDLFVSTSFPFEPFGLVILEAITAGIPVIGFRNGGLDEIIGNTSECLVDSGDVEMLAEKIYEYMHDSEKLTALANHQNEIYLHSYTLQIFQKNLLKLI
ncbi:MAG: glycosyltransferase family 4 protein, partial [Fibrobacter sp.]|nr:glycosyltransferase family 4 protein [Fibrobacter sp.]